MLLVSASRAETVLPEKVTVAACYYHARIISRTKKLDPQETFEKSTREMTGKFLEAFIGGLRDKGAIVETKRCPEEDPDEDEKAGGDETKTEVVFNFFVFPFIWGDERVAVGGWSRAGRGEKLFIFGKGERLPWLHKEDPIGLAASITTRTMGDQSG